MAEPAHVTDHQAGPLGQELSAGQHPGPSEGLPPVRFCSRGSKVARVSVGKRWSDKIMRVNWAAVE